MNLKRTSLLAFLATFALISTTSKGVRAAPSDLCGEGAPVECPDLDYPPCNYTSIQAFVVRWVHTLIPAGVNCTIEMPELEYPNCPDGLMQSSAVDLSVETKFLDNGPSQGGDYLSGGMAEKVCFENVPCRSVPEVSTIVNPNNCFYPRYSCNEEPIPGSTPICGKLAWCVTAQEPPPHAVDEIKLAWLNAIEDSNCMQTYGGGGGITPGEGM